MSEVDPRPTRVEASQSGPRFPEQPVRALLRAERGLRQHRQKAVVLVATLAVHDHPGRVHRCLAFEDGHDGVPPEPGRVGRKPFQAPPPRPWLHQGTFWAIALVVGPIFCFLSRGGLPLHLPVLFRGRGDLQAVHGHSHPHLPGDWAREHPAHPPRVHAQGGLEPGPAGGALQTNLTLLFPKDSVSKPLFALFGSLDLFSFWILFLLSGRFRCGQQSGRPAPLSGEWRRHGLWSLP